MPAKFLLLVLTSIFASCHPAVADEPLANTFSPERAARSLDMTAVAWQQEQKCSQCHANMIYLIARPALAKILPEPPDVRDFYESLVVEKWPERGLRYPAEAMVVGMPLAFSDQVRGELHPTTKAALDRMIQHQQKDGGWKWVYGAPKAYFRDYELTMFAALGIAVAPGYADVEPGMSALEKIRDWKREHPPATPLAKGMTIWAAKHIDGWATEAQSLDAAFELLELQGEDGGWATENLIAGTKTFEDTEFNTGRSSDAFGTGFVIFQCRNAGLPADHALLAEGVDWLRANQRESGRWFRRSLNGREQNVLSNSATAFAVLALDSCGEIIGEADGEASDGG